MHGYVVCCQAQQLSTAYLEEDEAALDLEEDGVGDGKARSRKRRSEADGSHRKRRRKTMDSGVYLVPSE